MLPIVSPGTAGGRLLMNPGASGYLSVMSQGVGAEIFYVDRDGAANFEEFAEEVLKRLARLAPDKPPPREPAVVIIERGTNSLLGVVELYGNSDEQQFITSMASILEALGKVDPESHLRNLQYLHTIKKYSDALPQNVAKLVGWLMGKIME